MRIRIYTMCSSKSHIALPNAQHLARRICFSNLLFKTQNEKEGYLEYEYPKLDLKELIEGINYIRQYCKYRSLFLSKFMILENPDLIFESQLKEAFEEKGLGIYQENLYPIIHFQNDSVVIPSD